MLVVLLFSITAWGQNTEDFDPASPIEPNQPVLPDNPIVPEDTTTYYVLSLLAQEGGSIKSGGGKYAAGTEVQVVANAAATNFVFTGWTNEKGDTISRNLSFLYTMPAKNAALLAHYDFLPGSPVEPSKPDIEEKPAEPVDTTTYYSLSLVAEEGGSITAGAGKYAAGTEVTVTASAPSTNFVFVGWTDEKGDTVSLERSFAYAMPASNKTLTAYYYYNPSSPVEPSEPDIKEKDPEPEPVPTHTLRITVEEGGSVTVNGIAVSGSSTLEIAEGTTATIATSISTNFTFDGWYRLTEEGSELYSRDKSFTFTMDTIDVALIAKYNYEPGAPSEPSMPVTTNSEMYLMSVVGLPGETINYPLYINTNDTLRDISFEMQFPVKMKPDFDNVAISANAMGYTFSYKRYYLKEMLGARRRAPGDNEGVISDDYVMYDIQMKGGITPPGNTALFVVPVTIEEDIELERHRIWLSQVQVMQNDSTVVGATTRNGAINTNYEEPDSYAYLDNLIKVGSSVYSTTQSQQISKLEPFTVDVPADSIAYVLGCSDVSFVTFKGRESLLKITDEETVENGFWFGTDGYVRQYVADADSMRMAVQYNPATHVMSIMQYPGAYKVGEADTVRVYFTYKYKYYEVELRLNINGADRFIELANELRDAKQSLLTFKPRITTAYSATKASDIHSLDEQCDSLVSATDGYISKAGSDMSDEEYDSALSLISEIKDFITKAESLIPLYEKAFEGLQTAKSSLASAVEVLADKATKPAIDAASALIYAVETEYTKYDVAKAEEMTDSLINTEKMVRNSVLTQSQSQYLETLAAVLTAEGKKIAECYAKTNADDISALGSECDALLSDATALQSNIDSLIATNDSLTSELATKITTCNSNAEAFIARADSLMPLYEEAYSKLQIALGQLSETINDVRGSVIKSIIADAENLYAEITSAQPSYAIKDYEEAEIKISDMIALLRRSVQTEDVEIAITESGTIEETIADPTTLETLTIAGPLNGTDIRFIRQEVPNLKTLDLSKAWIVEGGETYIDGLHTTNLTIGERMFAELPALESLILCDSVRSIDANILSNSLQVSTIAIPAMTETVAEGALDDSRKDIKVVWNAVNATVPALLNGNPNLMVYAVSGVKGEKEWQNIIHDGRMASLTLRDDYPLYIPESFLASEVTYARKFTKTANPKDAVGWESIVLPFDVKTVRHRASGRVLAPFGSEEKCDTHFWLGQMSADGFGKATSMTANTPYIIRMPNSDEYAEEDNVAGVITFTSTDKDGIMVHKTSDAKTIHGNGYTFVPTYDTINASESIFAINDTDYEGYLPGSVFVRNQRDVRPMEAYIIAEDGLARERGYIAITTTPTMETETAGITSTSTLTTTDKIFTLTGMRINKQTMKKGNIYIINGNQIKY